MVDDTTPIFKFEDSIRFKFHCFAATYHRLGRALLLFILLLLIRLRFFTTNTDPDTVPTSAPAEAIHRCHLQTGRALLLCLLLLFDSSLTY